MVDSSFCHQGNGIQVDPLPKYDIISHLVSLHFALHLNVEDLQVLPSYKARGEGREGEQVINMQLH